MRAFAALIAIPLSTVLIGAAGASAAVPEKTHKLPKDVCALLTDAQVSAVVPSAVAKPEPGTATQASCLWSAGSASLSVSVFKVTKGTPISPLPHFDLHTKGTRNTRKGSDSFRALRGPFVCFVLQRPVTTETAAPP